MDINSLEYAYIGDAVYEIYIRIYFIDKGIRKVNNLQKEVKNFVSATGQSGFLNSLIENNYLTENEIDIVYRARNYKTNSKPKHTDIATYKYATGLEALIGYLYLNKKFDRINELMSIILGDEDYVCTW